MDGKNIILLLLCVNIVLYIAGFQLTDDILTRFVDKESALQQGNIGVNQDVANRIPENPGGGDIRTGGLLGFIDVVLIFWDFLKLLFNIVTAPVALFTVGMHPVISMILGVPFVVMTLLVIVQFARGANL
jgi:hypothetical protein